MNALDPHGEAEHAERIRRETLAFNQWHRHRERWFTLRVVMGWVAVVTLPGVCLVAAFVIFNYEQFGAKAVTAASAALFTAVALLAAAWKRVLSDPPFEDEPPVEMADRWRPDKS